jgi:hypothetical protein
MHPRITHSGLCSIKQLIKIFGFLVNIFIFLINCLIDFFSGGTTTNFTSTNQLFLSNSQMNLWRFEVVYKFLLATSSSALNFIINPPPFNGSCSINPQNGTTSSLFTISCPNWFDQDGIKDYSLYSMLIFSKTLNHFFKN